MKIKDLKRNLQLAHGYFFPQEKLPKYPPSTISYIDFTFNVYRLDFTTDNIVFYIIKQCENKMWETYLQERNYKFDIKLFHSEHEACHDFFISMINHWAGQPFDLNPKNISTINRLYKYLKTYMAYYQIESIASYKRSLLYNYITYNYNGSCFRIIKKGNIWSIYSRRTAIYSTTSVHNVCLYFLKLVLPTTHSHLLK